MESVRVFQIIKEDLLPKTRFELPFEFVRTLSAADGRLKGGVLMSYKGKWDVCVRKSKVGSVCFVGQGWDDFVAAHEVVVKDFIVFEHVGCLQFNVFVFDETCCDKELISSDEDFMCRFFKVAVSGFETNLRLPPTFVSILIETELVLRTVVVRSSWKVRVRKCGNGLLELFGNNWQEYVGVHELRVNDFIVFEPSLIRGCLCFDTFVFDNTCCEKKNRSLESGEGISTGVVDARTASGAGSSNSDFQAGATRDFVSKISSIHHFNHVPVPADFARANGMTHTGTVELRNASGDSWGGKLTVSRRNNTGNSVYYRTRITGVSAFMTENELKIGDTCIFKVVDFSEDHDHFVMDVKFLRQGR